MSEPRPVRRPNPAATASPGKRAAHISAARVAAFEVLRRVERGEGHSDNLLHGPAMAHMSQEDRNLATTLVLGVLRWQIALDARIVPLLQRPDVVPGAEVLIALRMGAFQLGHLDRIPPHAALNESVELVRAAGHPHAAGMVNAILRKLAAAPPQGRKLHESAAALAERLGHPRWLVERWIASYGREAATAICEFDQQEPLVGAVFTQDDAAMMPVIDTGSRLVAEIAAAAMPNAKRIWDCCAAPGGKTLVLARRHRDAALLASDASAPRLLALNARLEREAPQAKITTALARAEMLPEEHGSFDLILCDVPCSGTGTLARNPEIRHHLRASDLTRQAERQHTLLSAALQRLAPGGKLVYSTCSLEREENEAVVASVQGILRRLRVERVSVEPLLDALKERGVLHADADPKAWMRDGFLRTLPGHNFLGDGFFAAVFSKP